MKKLFAVFAVLALVSCGEKTQGATEEQIANQQHPGYCIMDVNFSLDGHTAYIETSRYSWVTNKVYPQKPTEVSTDYWNNSPGILPLCQPTHPQWIHQHGQNGSSKLAMNHTIVTTTNLF